MSVYGRCSAPELIEKGVTVCLGSDAGAPDRGFDMFRHIAQCMHYHRRHFRDPSCMPPGKVLEMTTIDAAHALGLHDDLGSLEPGKMADIVLVDMRKPHLWPPNMPVTRLAHFANAADVDTVVVAGRILMQGRTPRHVASEAILEDADRELTLALERARQPRRQTVRQKADGRMALTAIPTRNLRAGRGLPRVGAVACHVTSAVRVIGAALKSCIAPRLGSNVFLAGKPRLVTKLHTGHGPAGVHPRGPLYC